MTPVRELIAELIVVPTLPTASVNVMENGKTPSLSVMSLTSAYAAST